MGWKDDVYDVIKRTWAIGQIFTLDRLYEYENEFSKSHSDNVHITDKIRQILQYLRDDGAIEFIDNKGTYRRLK